MGEVTLDPKVEAEYRKYLPEGTGKTLLVANCSVCHTLLEKLNIIRGDRTDWAATVDVMRQYMKKDPVLKKDLLQSDAELNLLLDYLAKNFGPNGLPKFNDVPESLQSAHLPQTALQGPAAKYRVFEYRLPGGVLPRDVAVDSKGIAWICESKPGMIGRFDPATYSYTRIPLPEAPPGKFGATYQLYAMEVDREDRVWASDGRNHRAIRYDPKTQKFATFDLPEPPQGNSNFNAIRFHSDGSIWATQQVPNRLVRLDPATKQVRIYPIPANFNKQDGGGYSLGANDPRNRGGARPDGMAIDGKGNIWFVAPASGKLGRLNPKSGEFDEFQAAGGAVLNQRMDSDVDGNPWFVSKYGNRIGKMDIRTDKMSLYAPPTPDSGPYSVSIDRKNNLIWFSEHLANKIARYDPRTDTFAEYSVASPLRDLRRIEVDRSRPNRIWYSGFYSDEFGYIEIAADK